MAHEKYTRWQPLALLTVLLIAIAMHRGILHRQPCSEP